MRAQHEGCVTRHNRYVIDENHADGLKVLHDEAIVDNLVVAVNRGLEDSRHPVEGLDGLFDASAKASRGGEYDSVNVHSLQPSK